MGLSTLHTKWIGADGGSLKELGEELGAAGSAKQQIGKHNVLKVEQIQMLHLRAIKNFQCLEFHTGIKKVTIMK